MNTKVQHWIGSVGAGRLFILAFIVLTVYPLIFVLLTSFKSTSEFYNNVWLLPQRFAWENYPKALFDAHVGEYFFTSLYVVGISVLVSLILGAMAGYALARLDVPYSGLMVFLFLAATFLPQEMIVMPLYLMVSKLKLAGTSTSLIIPYIGWAIPMNVFIFHGFFKSLPNELLEAARIDGCTETQAFTKVTMPIMLPAVATCAIFSFVGLWGELMWASIALSMSDIRTIPFGVITFKAQFGTDWGPMAAAICLTLIPLIVFFLFVQKYFVQGLTAGAVKG